LILPLELPIKRELVVYAFKNIGDDDLTEIVMKIQIFILNTKIALML